jgi:hypothetical protein
MSIPPNSVFRQYLHATNAYRQERGVGQLTACLSMNPKVSGLILGANSVIFALVA